MYFPSDATQSYPLSRLQLVVQTFGTKYTNQINFKVPKVDKPTNKKTYHKTLGTSVKKAQRPLPFCI